MPTTRFRPVVVMCTLLLALVAASCGGDEATITGDGDPIDGGDGTVSPVGDWVLTSLTIDGAPVVIPDDPPFDMTMEAGVIGGLGGCNRFGGELQIDPDGTMTITNLAMTEMACQPLSLLDFESAYVGALSRADSWAVTPTDLVLTGADVELRYAVAPDVVPLALEGTTWIFDTIFAGAGIERTASTPPLDRAEVTLVIEGGTAVLGADDCGEVSFPLAHEDGIDGNIALDADARPKAPCGEGSSNLPLALESVYASTGFALTEGRLTLIGLEGETVGFRAG